MSEKLVVIGTGGLARETMWQIREVNKTTNQYQILGFIDGDNSRVDEIVNGMPILGNDEWLFQCKGEINVVIAIGSGQRRKDVYEKLSINNQLKFPTMITGNVNYSDTVTFGQGTIIFRSNTFTTNISIGDFVVINFGCIIGHDVVIENFTTLSPGINIAGNVHLMEGVEIGMGSNIIQGKQIGKNTIIGAGATAIHDIPDNCTAVGIPAKPIKFYK